MISLSLSLLDLNLLVDMSINLRVSPDIQRVQDFFHKMGPSRLDAYLYFEVEELMRYLVNGVTHDKVNDLRSEFSTTVLRCVSFGA
jgi:hypothetical protein